MKAFLLGLLLFSSLPGTASFAQSSPPPSEQARQVEALVNKAAALIEKGKAAFSEFRVKDSEWLHDDTYVFVYDLESNVLLNTGIPAREGRRSAVRRMSMASCFTMT